MLASLIESLGNVQNMVAFRFIKFILAQFVYIVDRSVTDSMRVSFLKVAEKTWRVWSQAVHKPPTFRLPSSTGRERKFLPTKDAFETF